MSLENLQRLNIRVRPEMHQWLKETAESRGLTMNAIVIFALETYHQQQMVIPRLDDIVEMKNLLEKIESGKFEIPNNFIELAAKE